MLRPILVITIVSASLLGGDGTADGPSTRPAPVFDESIGQVFQELPYQGPNGRRRLILVEARISRPANLAPTAFFRKYGDQPVPNVALFLIDARLDGRIEGPILWCYYFGLGRIHSTLSAAVLRDPKNQLDVVVAYGRPERMGFEVFKADPSDVLGEYPLELDLMKKEDWPAGAKPVSSAFLDLSRSSTELCALTNLEALSVDEGIVCSMERKDELCGMLYLHYDRQTSTWTRTTIGPGEPIPAAR